jgi:tripartite-type tricarboxylate transporter receptor subunit TctC
MGTSVLRRAAAVSALAALTLSAVPAPAQPVGDFFRGKILSLYVGSGEGGGLDLYPRLLADYLTRYIPGNPSVIIRYLPGAGGVKAANFIYRIGPQDGTAYGFVTRGVVYAPLFHVPQAEFDPTRINWIGSTAKEVSIGAVWSASTDVRTIEDATHKEVVVGANSVGNDSGVFPVVLNELLGTKFRVVHGYKSGADISLALERGEVQGRVGWSVGSLTSGSTADWLREKKVTVLVQLGLFKHKNLSPDVPLALDRARSPEDRQLMELVFGATTIGWPSFMGPDVPKSRVGMVRAAYEQALRDPDLLTTAKKQRLEIDPLTAGDIERIIAGMYGTPQSIIGRARMLMKYAGAE